MATLLARQGRHRQLYQDTFRLVSRCIPYKVIKGCEEHVIKHRLQVLMISSPNRNDLVFPKGGWENDETVHEAASREAFEEAGVRGILNEIGLGVWEFRSKSREAKSSLEGGCRGYMFALEVTEELDTWPEQENHERKWLNIEDAFDLCRYDWMREALRAFLKQKEREDYRQEPKMNNLIIPDSSAKPKMNYQTIMDSSTKPRMNNQTVMDSSLTSKMNQMVMDTSVTIATAITPVPDCQAVKITTTTNCSVNSKTIVVFQLV